MLVAGLAVHAGTRSATIIEFHNVNLDHYFLTANWQEAKAIDAGLAGPAWVRTGYTFFAWTEFFGFTAEALGEFPPRGFKRVSRFHAPGANSHFYTADPGEIESLQRPGTGWNSEGDAFLLNVPESTGQCASFLRPMHRLYNNRGMFNDGNHRFVLDESERQIMVARGWIDEGIAFCAPWHWFYWAPPPPGGT